MNHRPHVHLVSARWSNFPWGFGNEVFRALLALRCPVTDTDFRVANNAGTSEKDRRNLLAERLRVPADIVLVLKGDGIQPDWIRGAPGVTALWFPDDLLATQHGPAIIDFNGAAYDLVYGVSQHDLGEYAKHGAKEARWLPLAHDPKLHRKLADAEKEHDVCFIGSIYDNRKAVLERLKGKFDVLVAGVFGVEMVKLYNASRIVLNVSVGTGNIPHRIFEAMGCGSLLLTERIETTPSLFEDKVHLVYYDDQEHLEELIAYYLEHDEEREAIAAQGRAEVLRKHTVAHRILTIFDNVRETPKWQDHHRN